MKFMYFSIKYCYSDILLKKNINFIYSCLLCSNHTCYCVNMVSVTSVSRYMMWAALSKKILDVHPWSESTEFPGIGQGSYACLLYLWVSRIKLWWKTNSVRRNNLQLRHNSYRDPISSGNHGKPGKALKNSSMHGKNHRIRKKCKNWIIMEKSCNFVK